MTTLPLPPHWPTGWHRLLRTKALLALSAVAALLEGVVELLTRNYSGALVGAAFFISLTLAVVVLLRVSAGHVRVRADHGPSGTTVRPDELTSQLGLLAIVIFVVTGTNCVVGALLGRLQPFGAIGSQSSAAVLAGGGTLVAIGGLFAAWRRGGIDQVTLTSAGIEYVGLKQSVSVRTIAWDDIVGITDHTTSDDDTSRAIVLRRRDKTRQTIDDADVYVPNGIGLYWMVWHYWRHPDDRVELTDGRALDRLAAGRFDTSVP